MYQRSPFSPSPSYLDPVTGNILIQVILAGAAAVAVGYNSLKTKVQLLFGKKCEPKDEQPQDEEKSEEDKASESAAEEAAQAPPSGA